MIDYDLVIIGGTLAGRYAALKASQLRAKVALIEPENNLSQNLSSGLVYLDALSEVSKRKLQLENASDFGILFSQYSSVPESEDAKLSGDEAATVTPIVGVDWDTLMLRTLGVELQARSHYSLKYLAAQGIDIVIGAGHFQAEAKLSFLINNRLIIGRRYLLATGSLPKVDNIEGLQKTGFLTLANIWQVFNAPSVNANKMPQNWVILGGIPQSIQLAQTLNRLGYHVTLICDRSDILSHIDTEINQLLQAQLEAEGVRIFTKTCVTQVLQIDGKKWLQAGDKAIETDEIVVATHQIPNIESLNLASVGVKWYQNRLHVNEKLQTTNSRIYACGDVIGGYTLTNVAHYEADIALKNALFFSTAKVDYKNIAWGISTQPMFAQVGLLQSQAENLYNSSAVLVLRQYFKSLVTAQIRDETTGVCKVVVLRNGVILGASIIGAEAREIINIIAVAMNRKLKINQLASLCFSYPSFSSILEAIAQDWQLQRLNHNLIKQELLDDFFQIRRNWDI
ncbi:NAD(P)/FAD-dependent oxidoreductase [Calothrix sp. UHCC 0171]|uniref:dihydrolipoyl dehydrogenase family protein n=1 Tax=Calothrix sp. UHCC 0171 TaxID=3110245 RepID=UPI002B1F3DC9|nr:NAD(P)/FAD-dependent oxidoreductase [Calothrix sp. UHCC 0171]MEA5571015.1 NAD(P)/FAD-dependent oxidoreductase [Calothrix sp. UHCC 0171]